MDSVGEAVAFILELLAGLQSIPVDQLLQTILIGIDDIQARRMLKTNEMDALQMMEALRNGEKELKVLAIDYNSFVDETAERYNQINMLLDVSDEPEAKIVEAILRKMITAVERADQVAGSCNSLLQSLKEKLISFDNVLGRSEKSIQDKGINYSSYMTAKMVDHTANLPTLVQEMNEKEITITKTGSRIPEYNHKLTVMLEEVCKDGNHASLTENARMNMRSLMNNSRYKLEGMRINWDEKMARATQKVQENKDSYQVEPEPNKQGFSMSSWLPSCPWSRNKSEKDAEVQESLKAYGNDEIPYDKEGRDKKGF